jgi:hypothetical protein
MEAYPETGQGWRIYTQNLSGGRPKAITPEIAQPNTYDGPSASPDGGLVWARDLQLKGWLYPTNGGRPTMLNVLAPEDHWISWTPDSTGVYVFTADALPSRVFHIDFSTGKRTEVFTVMPSDPAGVAALSVIRLSPDAKSYAYSYVRVLSKLFLVTGVN